MADAAYQTTSFRFEAGSGIVARSVYDAAPKGTYWNYDNCQSREEGATSSRFGLYPLSTDGVSQNFALGAPVNSLSRMQGIGTPYRYAGTTVGKLFRRAGNGQGAFTQIATGLSGDRMSMSPYRPANSSAPWQFIADDALLLKDSGTLATAGNWGIAPPSQPALIAPVPPALIDVELFDEVNDASFTLSNITSVNMIGRVACQITNSITSTGVQIVVTPSIFIDTLTRSAGVATATCGAAHGFVTGMRVAVSSPNDPTFNASSAIITVTGADTFTYPSVGTTVSTVNGTVNPLPSFMAGMSVTTTDGSPETVYITEVTTTGFVADFVRTHVAPFGITSSYLGGTVAANTLAQISKARPLNLSFNTTQVAEDQNYVQLYLLVTNPLAITQVTLLFDVGDGSFTQDYYSKAISMSPAQTTASGTVLASAAQTAAVALRAAGGVQVSTLGGNNPSLLPTDYPLLQQMQPVVLDPGANPWSYIQVPLSDFIENGAAGGANNNWSDVVAWAIQIQTAPTLSTVVGVDDLVFVGGSDLNSFAGQAYDYRYTYLNINTGCESNPSITMAASDPTTFAAFLGAFLPIPLSVQQQAIEIEPLQPTDPQVTHINIYRRGGSLTQAWYFVVQIPVGQTTFIDTIADSIIEDNNQLLIDSDAPVTALLPTPLNATVTVFGSGHIPAVSMGPGLTTVTLTGVGAGVLYPNQFVTIGVGAIQEQCYIEAVAGSRATVYLQFFHGSDVLAVEAPITATTRPQQPMNLFAIAFDQAFLAGDPNNPHVLYYSRTYAPETFPSENFIEVGTPDSPIMALVVLRGFLYVFTTKTVYQIYGGSGSTPTAIPTGVMHGMAASFAWAASENVVYYLSYDGVYAFTGSGSQYLTQNTEWIWTSRTETNGVIPVLNPAYKNDVFMAYGNHEVFVAYQDVNTITHRQIASDSYSRWRNDDQLVGNITAMFFEQDTGQMLVGKDDGMVYLDQVNDYDSGGYNSSGQIVNPIAINLQTPQLDLGVPKAYKNFNEVTIDATLPNGLEVTVFAIFDSQSTQTTLGIITGTGNRVQYQLNIAAGLGYRSLNMGLMLIGETTAQAIFHEGHVRAVIEAEERQSYDSYKLDFDDAWKVFKQGWFTFAAPDPGGIAMSIYTDENPIPAYEFTLPQTLPASIRTTVKVRFPPLKCRIIRLVGTSNSPFQLYSKDSELEYKGLAAQKGYVRGALST